MLIGALVIGVVFVVLANLVPTKERVVIAPKISGPKGRLRVITPAEFQIGTSRMILCGVRFEPAIKALVTDEVRRKYENKYVECLPVGRGTLCDGKSVTMMGSAIVGTCALEDGSDLAQHLIDDGYLKGTIAEYSN